MNQLLVGMSFFLIICALVLLAAFVYLQWPAWKLRHVPVAPYIWGIGHSPLLVKYNEDTFSRLAKQLGPVYRFHLGRQPVVIVTTAELCQELGLKKFKSASDHVDFPFMKSRLHMQGIYMARGATWNKIKDHLMLPILFHPEKLSEYVSPINRVLDDVNLIFKRHADSNEHVHLSALLKKMSLEIMGATAFGIRFSIVKGTSEKDEDSDLAQAAIKSMSAISLHKGASLSTIVGTMFPFMEHGVREVMRRIPGTMDWTQHTGNERVEQEIQALIEKKVAENNGRMGERRADAVSFFLDGREKSQEIRELLTHERVKGLCFELLLAGSESPTHVLGYTLYLISCHPEVERKVIEEIDRLAPDTRTEVSYNDLDKFVYLEQVLNESMRMVTLNPLLIREAVEDIEISGYSLPKGTWIFMAPTVLHKNDRDFPEPHLFRPERFDPNGKEAKERHPYSHLPFGIGPRLCTGIRFACMEMKLALIKFYQRFTFTHSPLMEKPLDLQMGILVRVKYGIKVQVHER